MSIHTRWSRITVTGITAATFALFVGASPANAVPAPEPSDQAVYLPTCPRIDALAQSLRTGGFSPQAAANYAIFTRQDCLDEI